MIRYFLDHLAGEEILAKMDKIDKFTARRIGYCLLSEDLNVRLFGTSARL